MMGRADGTAMGNAEVKNRGLNIPLHIEFDCYNPHQVDQRSTARSTTRRWKARSPFPTRSTLGSPNPVSRRGCLRSSIGRSVKPCAVNGFADIADGSPTPMTILPAKDLSTNCRVRTASNSPSPRRPTRSTRSASDTSACLGEGCAPDRPSSDASIRRD
jgi:hypothetical protein